MANTERNSLILVPIDFTEAAACAINHAMNVAKSGGDEICLAHIINSDTKSKLKKEGKTISDLEAQMQGECDKIKEQSGIEANYALREGSIFTTIGEIAEEKKARLLIMGTHGVKGVQHLIGAFAVKVITTSPVPVIIVQKKKIDDHGYKKIVFPINENKENKHKLLHTVSIARQYGAEVHLYADYDSDEFIANAIRNNVAHAKNFFVKNEVKVVETQREKGGNYGKQLIKYASGVDADLIVILTDEGDAGVAEFILGAENEKIINNDSQIAVMCVNPIEDLYKIGNILFQ